MSLATYLPTPSTMLVEEIHDVGLRREDCTAFSTYYHAAGGSASSDMRLYLLLMSTTLVTVCLFACYPLAADNVLGYHFLFTSELRTHVRCNLNYYFDLPKITNRNLSSLRLKILYEANGIAEKWLDHDGRDLPLSLRHGLVPIGSVPNSTACGSLNTGNI